MRRRSGRRTEEIGRKEGDKRTNYEIEWGQNECEEKEKRVEKESAGIRGKLKRRKDAKRTKIEG